MYYVFHHIVRLQFFVWLALIRFNEKHEYSVQETQSFVSTSMIARVSVAHYVEVASRD